MAADVPVPQLAKLNLLQADGAIEGKLSVIHEGSKQRIVGSANDPDDGNLARICLMAGHQGIFIQAFHLEVNTQILTLNIEDVTALNFDDDQKVVRFCSGRKNTWYIMEMNRDSDIETFLLTLKDLQRKPNVALQSQSNVLQVALGGTVDLTAIGQDVVMEEEEEIIHKQLIVESKLVDKLQEAIQVGNEEMAREIAGQLAEGRTKMSVFLSENGKDHGYIRIAVNVEFQEGTACKIQVLVSPEMTVFALKAKMTLLFYIPLQIQRWIVGKKSAMDHETLRRNNFGQPGNQVYLYLLNRNIRRQDEGQLVWECHQRLVHEGKNPDFIMTKELFEDFVKEKYGPNYFQDMYQEEYNLEVERGAHSVNAGGDHHRYSQDRYQAVQKFTGPDYKHDDALVEIKHDQHAPGMFQNPFRGGPENIGDGYPEEAFYPQPEPRHLRVKQKQVVPSQSKRGKLAFAKPAFGEEEMDCAPPLHKKQISPKKQSLPWKVSQSLKHGRSHEHLCNLPADVRQAQRYKCPPFKVPRSEDESQNPNKISMNEPFGRMRGESSRSNMWPQAHVVFEQQRESQKASRFPFSGKIIKENVAMGGNKLSRIRTDSRRRENVHSITYGMPRPERTNENPSQRIKMPFKETNQDARQEAIARKKYNPKKFMSADDDLSLHPFERDHQIDRELIQGHGPPAARDTGHLIVGAPNQRIYERLIWKSEKPTTSHPQTDMILPTAYDIGWTCEKCTCVNPPRVLLCRACAARRLKEYVVPHLNTYVMDVDEKKRYEEEKRNEALFKKLHEDEKRARRMERFVNYQKYIEVFEQDLTFNKEEFKCPICIDDIKIGEGLLLRDCLHEICLECLRQHILLCETPEVNCPYTDDDGNQCKQVVTEQEVRKLITKEEFAKHLQRSLNQAEASDPNTFHCLTPNCTGFCFYIDELNFFECPVCDHENCLTCKVMHEGKDCREYQDGLIQNQNHKAAQASLNALEQMLANGEAMKCPHCGIYIRKKGGCPNMTCSVCKRGFKWTGRPDM